MMMIYSKVCRRISRNCMSWIMMPIQPNLSAKSFADLDSEVVTSAFFSNDDDNSPKLLKGRMKRAKMIKMMKKVCHQCVLQL